MKVAVLSMDIEDWYHLDYFRGMVCDRGRSLLDGVQIFRAILAENGIRATFFVLGELAGPHRRLLVELARDGHEIAAHGEDHTRPMTMDVEEFSDDLRRTKDTLEEAVGLPIHGYRAPCFSLDRQRLDRVREAGFLYDSSRMPFDQHPLYGSLDIDDFELLSPNVYRDADFFEYQLSALPVAGRVIPVSGGAYVRVLPWILMKRLIGRYLRSCELYIWYVHPFELSRQPAPPLPDEAGSLTRLRFGLGRRSVARKLAKIIALLRTEGFEFMTLAGLRQGLLENAGRAS